MLPDRPSEGRPMTSWKLAPLLFLAALIAAFVGASVRA